MNDDSTNVLGQPPQPPGDETHVLPRPPAPAPGGQGVPAKKGKPWWLVLLWALLRLGAIGAALLLTAQLTAAYSEAAPLLQWIVALIAALLIPTGLYLFLRKAVKKRSPRAHFKLSWLTWSFGWAVVIATLVWVNLPGIGTMAVGEQGANLARGIAAATAPDHAATGAVVWLSKLAVRVTGAIEARILGEEATRARRDAGQQALEAYQSGPGSGEEEGGEPIAPERATVASATGSNVRATEARPASSLEHTSAVQGGAEPPSGSPTTASVDTTGPAASTGTSSSTATASAGAMPVPLPGKATAPAPETSTIAKRAVVEVPFEQEGNALLIDVVINRRFPARLKIDSAVPYTTLDGTTLRRMGITPEAGAPTVTIDTPSGPQTDVVLTLDTIAVGGLEVVGPTIMRCNDCRTLTYQGILGYNVLSNFQMSIDNAQSVLLFSDRRDTADRGDDIRPFVELRANPKPSSGEYQPFVIQATNRAGREIGTLFARLTLMDDNRMPVGSQDIKLPPIPPGETVTKLVDVPRSPPFTYFAVDLGAARW